MKKSEQKECSVEGKKEQIKEWLGRRSGQVFMSITKKNLSIKIGYLIMKLLVIPQFFGFFVVSPKDVLEELVSRQEKESLKSLSDSESELLL